MLNLLRKSAARKREGRRLYDALVSRSREPVFFADFGVADSIDGRFDMLVFHAWLVLAELKGAESAQALTDTIFTGFDEAMREQGAGDMGIGHKLKAMGNAFYGRIAVYDATKIQEELAAALANESEAAGFTAGIFSQRSGIGRNLTIQVLEYLDRIGVTRRDGEYRHVHREVGTVLA